MVPTQLGIVLTELQQQFVLRWLRGQLPDMRSRWANGTDPTGHCIDGVTTAICIAMAAGAIAGYAIQVGENRAQGMDWGAALTTNISGEKILAGAVIGGGVIVAAAAASVGIAAIGAVGAAACADGDCTNEAQAISTTVTKAGESADDLIPTTGKIVQPLNVVDKSRSVDQFLNDANKFLGDKYQQIASGIYRAEDGLRQVRFTDSDIQAMNSRSLGSHGHFELLNNVGKVIKNIHIPLIGK